MTKACLPLPRQPLTRQRRSGNERGLRYGRRELSDPLVQQLNAAASAPDLASVGIAQYYPCFSGVLCGICARKHTGAKTDRCGINCECTDCVVHLVNQRETLGSDLVRNRRLRERSCRGNVTRKQPSVSPAMSARAMVNILFMRGWHSFASSYSAMSSAYHDAPIRAPMACPAEDVQITPGSLKRWLLCWKNGSRNLRAQREGHIQTEPLPMAV